MCQYLAGNLVAHNGFLEVHVGDGISHHTAPITVDTLHFVNWVREFEYFPERDYIEWGHSSGIGWQHEPTVRLVYEIRRWIDQAWPKLVEKAIYREWGHTLAETFAWAPPPILDVALRTLELPIRELEPTAPLVWPGGQRVRLGWWRSMRFPSLDDEEQIVRFLQTDEGRERLFAASRIPPRGERGQPIVRILQYEPIVLVYRRPNHRAIVFDNSGVLCVADECGIRDEL